MIFWDVTPCLFVDSLRRFGRICHLRVGDTTDSRRFVSHFMCKLWIINFQISETILNNECICTVHVVRSLNC